jgi:hypothetical protein
MQQEPVHFDDTDLKAILKRTVGSETAPAGLRGRIEAAIAAQQRREQVRHKMTSHRWQKPIFGLAAAAVLLIGFGLTFTLLFSKEKAAPQWFAQAMVKTHDEYPGGTVLPPGVNGEDYPAISKYLSDQLGFPVLAEPLGDGWKFEGARQCVVGNTNAAQIFYRKGDQTVSLFSVPAGMLYYSDPAKEGMNYSQVESGHAISGFVRGKAIHCLVAHSKTGTPDLKALTELREKLRAASQPPSQPH